MRTFKRLDHSQHSGTRIIQRDLAGRGSRMIGPLLCTAALLLADGAREARADVLAIGGEGDGVVVEAIGVRTRQWKAWKSTSGWQYALSGEYQIGVWRGQQSMAADRRLVDTSFTPVLTIRAMARPDLAPYMEIGLGAHLLSGTRIDNRNLSTAFQFGEFIGLGADLGVRHRHSLSARVQHVSNGSIRLPNDGVTFGQLVFSYRF